MTRRRSQRGAAVVDFVLVLVVLVPLFLGIVQVALVLHVRNTLGAAASEGARSAAVLGGTPARGHRVARDQVAAGIAGRYADDIQVTETTLQGAPAYRVRIRATVPALGLGGPGVRVEVAGTAVRELP